MANFPKGFVPDAPESFPDGFVPDAQPDSPELDAIGPRSFLHPDKFKPSPQHRKFAANTGPIEPLLSGLEAEARHHDNTLDSDLEHVAAPVNSLVDRATFGGYGAALHGATRLNEATGTTGPTLASRTLEGIDRYRQEAPTLSRYTDAPAYFAAPAKAIAGGVERLLPQVANPLARAARATLASGGTGALMGGTEAAFNGEGLGEGAADAARAGAAGLLTGAAVAAPLSLSSLAARAVIGSRGGQARQFLEGKGVEVGPGTPGRGGPMDTMETRGTSDADIGRQAEVSARKGIDMLNEEQRGVQGALGRRIGSIAESPEGAQLRDVSSLVANAEAALHEFGTNPQAKSAIEDFLATTRAKQGQHFNPDVDSYFLTESDLNAARRDLDTAARTGLSNAAQFHPLREAANEARSMVNEGPFKEANADFSLEARRYQKSRRLLGLAERNQKPEEPDAAVNKVKNLITRRGQNTVTSGGQEDRLRRFENRHPDIAEEFARPEILRKRADISLHLLPQRHGGLIDRTGSAIGGAAALEALAHAASAGHVDPSKVAAAALLGLGTQNINAINARFLYGPAQEALRLERPLFEDVPLGGAALIGAARNSMEKR